MPSTIVRTPKRPKVWTYERDSVIALATSGSKLQISYDLLTTYKTDLGITRPNNVTVMRIVGKLLAGNTASASVATEFTVNWGIAWLDARLAALPSGDTSIPDPGALGVREAEWIQRGMLFHTSVAGAQTTGANAGQLASWTELDITQRRKQPTPDHELCLVTDTSGSSSHAPMLGMDLAIWLAV